MHQSLIQWIDGTIEVVSTDSLFSIASAEAHTWSYERVSCFFGQVWEKDFSKVADYEQTPIQAVGSSDGS